MGAVEKCQDRDVLSARFGYEISGSGEVISFISSNFRAKLTPDNSGLDIEPSFMGNEKNDFNKGSSPNELVISGVPRIKGVITVEIVAKTYASMYSKSQVFTKKISNKC